MVACVVDEGTKLWALAVTLSKNRDTINDSSDFNSPCKFNPRCHRKRKSFVASYQQWC